MDLAAGALIVFGFGFLVANLRLLAEWIRFLRRRKQSLLVWPPPRPPYYGLMLALGLVTGLLMLFKILIVRRQIFGEAMMFVYFGYLVPVSARILRGFYEDGLWSDSGFVSYDDIGGISWREDEHAVTLIVASRSGKLARRMSVPLRHYGEARRLLRDKIGDHQILLAGAGLDLGLHDQRDDA